MIIHLSWHPGPDPDKEPLAWEALCGITTETAPLTFSPTLGEVIRGYQISTNPKDVDCNDCLSRYMTGEFEGLLSEKTPPPETLLEYWESAPVESWESTPARIFGVVQPDGKIKPYVEKRWR